MSAPLPFNESSRLSALQRYRFLEEDAGGFDDFARLAAFICGTPMSLLSIIAETEQLHRAKVGTEMASLPREHSFCAHTILGRDLMIVEDAQADARFAANPLVLADPHIRFYAGAPLVDREGFALGAICVLDREPRVLSSGQREALRALADQIINVCELRRISDDLAKALAEIKVLGGMLPMCGHCKRIRNDQGYWQQLEKFLHTHTDARLSHGICPECIREMHPEVYAELFPNGAPMAD